MLVAVGLGRLSPMQVKSILESRDPLGKQQSRVAPAHGLFLKSVLYGDIGKMQHLGHSWRINGLYMGDGAAASSGYCLPVAAQPKALNLLAWWSSNPGLSTGALSEAPDTWVHTPHEEASKATTPLEVSPTGPSSYHPIPGPGRGQEDQYGHGCAEPRAAFSPFFTRNGTDFT